MEFSFIVYIHIYIYIYIYISFEVFASDKCNENLRL
jgi:hypothetical protein